MEEYEIFYDEIKDSGSGVFRITVPEKLAKFNGYKVGDKVKVMIKKLPPVQEEEKRDD